MSEAHIPAWKRAGLKQATTKQAKKQTTEYDPLKEGLKRIHEHGDAKKPAKPPKKLKVAKSERPAPTHELDQLAYLRQYTEDRENWKFSKQKQNWVLKHLFSDINDDKYDTPVLNYVSGLQGSSRNWVKDDATEVIRTWNEFMAEDLKSREDSVPGDGDAGIAAESGAANNDKQPIPHTDSAKSEQREPEVPDVPHEAVSADDNKANEPGKSSKGKKSQNKQSDPPAKKIPSEKMVRRARDIVKLITGETPKLELLD